MTAPRGDRCEFWIGIDFDAPSFVVRQMPVEAVELVPGENVEEALNFGCAVELPRHIEMAAPPAACRIVANLAFCWKDEDLRMAARTPQNLTQRDQPVKQARTR